MVQCPFFQVPQGCTVRVRAQNGASAGNSGVIFVKQFLGDPGKPLAPLDDVACPVTNTGTLFITGAAGDGAVVNVVSVLGVGQ